MSKAVPVGCFVSVEISLESKSIVIMRDNFKKTRLIRVLLSAIISADLVWRSVFEEPNHFLWWTLKSKNMSKWWIQFYETAIESTFDNSYDWRIGRESPGEMYRIRSAKSFLGRKRLQYGDMPSDIYHVNCHVKMADVGIRDASDQVLRWCGMAFLGWAMSQDGGSIACNLPWHLSYTLSCQLVMF